MKYYNTKQTFNTRKRKCKNNKITPIAIFSLALTAGCVISPEQNASPDGSPEEADTSESTDLNEEDNRTEIIASSTSTSTELGAELRLDIYALESVGNDLLRLRLALTNESSGSFFLYSGLSDNENLHSASAISLIDAEEQKRYLSYTLLDGSCFCSSISGNISPGKSEEMWVIFPDPGKDKERMTIITPMTPPLVDVPISESSETVDNSGLDDPEIVPLTLISDSLEDQTGRSEREDEVSIILSSDVLFKTDSSELSTKAEEILEEVASEIEEASPENINIDGYADNTGNDSVNIPLSQERAESVEESLSELIDNDETSFTVDGHGSADPIADNDTKEGRERNRRVTVTFENQG